VLAIDHGSARCGCAVSDPTGTIVTPIEPISPPDPAAVADLVAERGVETVVVGLPVSLDGAEGAQAAEARVFATAVAGLVQVPVDTYDERLTTRMASASRRAGSRASEDSLAAAHLLETYLLAREARR
jgi:putative Holliday junction resolvase